MSAEPECCSCRRGYHANKVAFAQSLTLLILAPIIGALPGLALGRVCRARNLWLASTAGIFLTTAALLAFEYFMALSHMNIPW